MNIVEPIINTLQEGNKKVLVIDKLPSSKSKVVEIRIGNGPHLQNKVQREMIHAPVDKNIILLDVVVDASNK